ncbi:hypothetical protein AAZX31_11G248500 [Glycine max]
MRKSNEVGLARAVLFEAVADLGLVVEHEIFVGINYQEK